MSSLRTSLLVDVSATQSRETETRRTCRVVTHPAPSPLPRFDLDDDLDDDIDDDDDDDDDFDADKDEDDGGDDDEEDDEDDSDEDEEETWQVSKTTRFR
jgi:hypothetical protein